MYSIDNIKLPSFTKKDSYFYGRARKIKFKGFDDYKVKNGVSLVVKNLRNTCLLYKQTINRAIIKLLNFSHLIPNQNDKLKYEQFVQEQLDIPFTLYLEDTTEPIIAIKYG